MKTEIESYAKYLDHQYRLGNALISDSAFNHLDKNLVKTKTKFNYFTNQTKCLPNLPKGNYKFFLNTLLNKTRLSIEPKISGCTVAIEYINGKINKAISKNGKEITNKILEIKNIPQTLPIDRNFQVRGELYENGQTPLNSRISANNFIYKDGCYKKNLNFCSFQILNGRLNQYETLNYLKKCGFSTPNCYFTNFTSQVEFFRKEWLAGNVFSNYPTTGIVIKINSRKLQLLREKNYSYSGVWQFAIED
tara:strand:+ start:9132 stop:9878 length:747 start_codon:yes stop_codon:yes gene_type:complete